MEGQAGQVSNVAKKIWTDTFADRFAATGAKERSPKIGNLGPAQGGF